MVTPQENTRRSRINSVIRAIRKSGEDLNETALRHEVMAKYGVTQRTANEYIVTAKGSLANKGELIENER